MGSDSCLIDVDERTILLATVLGLTVRGSDGVHELTPKGGAWLREWCHRKLKEAGVV